MGVKELNWELKFSDVKHLLKSGKESQKHSSIIKITQVHLTKHSKPKLGLTEVQMHI